MQPGISCCRTIAPDRSPFGSKDCIYMPRTMWEGGNTYYIVNSDTVRTSLVNASSPPHLSGV